MRCARRGFSVTISFLFCSVGVFLTGFLCRSTCPFLDVLCIHFLHHFSERVTTISGGKIEGRVFACLKLMYFAFFGSDMSQSAACFSSSERLKKRKRNHLLHWFSQSNNRVCFSDDTGLCNDSETLDTGIIIVNITRKREQGRKSLSGINSSHWFTITACVREWFSMSQEWDMKHKCGPWCNTRVREWDAFVYPTATCAYLVLMCNVCRHCSWRCEQEDQVSGISLSLIRFNVCLNKLFSTRYMWHANANSCLPDKERKEKGFVSGWWVRLFSLMSLFPVSLWSMIWPATSHWPEPPL